MAQIVQLALALAKRRGSGISHIFELGRFLLLHQPLVNEPSFGHLLISEHPEWNV